MKYLVMKYIVYKKSNNRVYNDAILDRPPNDLTDTLDVARCETIPTYNKANGEYLEVFNIQEHTETYTEKVEKEVLKVDEQGNEYTETEYEEVVKTRPYKTCELCVKQDERIVKAYQLRKLKSWFDTEYREYFEKFTRWEVLGIQDAIIDELFDITYNSIVELYEQGEKIRNEIKTLKQEIYPGGGEI